MNKPNVLLIFTDQQRLNTLGFLNPKCKTPNLDKLAQRGVAFSRCMTTAPLCTPARSSVFTGKYPHQVKGHRPEKMQIDDSITNSSTTMLTNFFITDHEPVFSRLLKEAGYETSYAGKWHLGNEIIHDWWDRACGYDTKLYSKWCEESGLKDGWAFNDYNVRSKIWPHMSIPTPAVMDMDPENHGDSWIASKAIDYIKTRDKDKPFFTVCSFNGPHPPFKIPEPYFSMFDENDIVEPENFNHLEGKPEYVKNCYYHQLFEEYGDDFSKWKKSFAVYYGFVKLLDDQVGKLLECLEEENVIDDTLIIFISDHGEMLGSHGLWHKMAPYEEAVRVPMIFSAPFIKQGVISDEPVSLLDVAETVLDFADVKDIPEDMEGKSIKGVITEGETLGKRLLFSEHRPLGEFHKAVNFRLVTDNDFKYVWNEGDLDELYNLKEDPHEMVNLINNAEYADEAKYYLNAIREWMVDTDDVISMRRR